MATVKRVYEQMYPATYNFKDDTDGSEPDDWTSSNDASTTTTIIALLDGHRKVLQLYDNNAAGKYDVEIDFASAQTSGTVELWFHTTDNTLDHIMQLLQTDNTIAIQVDLNAIAGVGDDTWYHYKIKFDCTPDTYDHDLDGTSIATGVGFTNPVTNIITIKFIGTDADSGYYNYIDAIGVSWDANYNIGDNVFWRHYKEGSDPFESEDWGVQGTSISYVTSISGAASAAEIVPEFNEHKKILRLTEVTGNDTITHNLDSQAKAGWWSGWVKVSDVTGDNFYDLREGASVIIRMRITLSKFQYRARGGAYTDVGLAAVNNTWYFVYIQWYDAANDTIDLWIDNIQYLDGVQTFINQTNGINRHYLLQTTAAYLYLNAPMSSSDSDSRADNRTLDYHDSYTREDVTTSIVLNPFTKDEYGWSIAQIEDRKGTLGLDSNSFIQIEDENSDLRFEGFYHGKITHSELYIYHDLNKIFLRKPVTYTASSPEDANATFLGICTNVGQASGRCIYYTEDDPAGDLTPVYRGSKPFRLVAAERAAIASRILIIKPNGVCFLDSDATPAQGAYTITSASGEIMSKPVEQQTDTQVNFVRVEGAIDPNTGDPFFGEDEDTSAQTGTVGVVRYYRRFLDLRSNTDCASKAASLRVNLDPSGIVVELLGVYANPGEIINFAYSPLSISAANYYVETVTYNLIAKICTYTLNDGLFNANDAAMIQFSEGGDIQADINKTIYETDIITPNLNLLPLGGSEGGFGIATIKTQYAIAWFYLPPNVDDGRDLIIDFVFRNAAHGARTTDGELLVAK